MEHSRSAEARRGQTEPWGVLALTKMDRELLVDVLADQAVAAKWVRHASPSMLDLKGRDVVKAALGRVCNLMGQDLIDIGDKALPPGQEADEGDVLVRLMRLLYGLDEGLPAKFRDSGIVQDMEQTALSECMDPPVGPFVLCVFFKDMLVKSIDHWVQRDRIISSPSGGG